MGSHGGNGTAAACSHGGCVQSRRLRWGWTWRGRRGGPADGVAVEVEVQARRPALEPLRQRRRRPQAQPVVGEVEGREGRAAREGAGQGRDGLVVAEGVPLPEEGGGGDGAKARRCRGRCSQRSVIDIAMRRGGAAARRWRGLSRRAAPRQGAPQPARGGVSGRAGRDGTPRLGGDSAYERPVQAAVISGPVRGLCVCACRMRACACARTRLSVGGTWMRSAVRRGLRPRPAATARAPGPRRWL